MMKRKLIIALYILILYCGVFAIPLISYCTSNAQMTDACSDGRILVVDATNKRYKCISANIPLVYRATGVSLNSATTDVATITGLPPKYIVRRFTADNPSINLTLATVDLRTSTGGGGTAVVSAGALTALISSTKYVDLTLAVTSDTLTSSSLVIRNITPQGATATADFTIEVIPL